MVSLSSLSSHVLTNPLPPSLPRYTDMVNELETVGDDPNQFNEYGEAPLCVAANHLCWHVRGGLLALTADGGCRR